MPDSIPGRYGTVLIISGPSGAGKSTVCERLLELAPALHFSVSCTTRPARPGEQDGVDYHFISADEFRRRLAAGAFLEHAEVHGNLYGTLRDEVAAYVQRGEDVLLDIDVQGAAQLRRAVLDWRLRQCVVDVFFAPPSLHELERRLRGRHTDSPEAIARRLQNARAELAAWREFAYIVVNDDIDAAARRLLAILEASHHATARIAGTPAWAGITSEPGDGANPEGRVQPSP